MEGDHRDLQTQLQQAQAKIAKLKEALLTSQSNATELRDIIDSQQKEFKQALAARQDQEGRLLSRCELAERRVEELQVELLRMRQAPAAQVVGTGSLTPPAPTCTGIAPGMLSVELQRAGQAFAEATQSGMKSTVGVADNTLMQSAVSMFEGALGMMKAFAAGAKPGLPSTAVANSRPQLQDQEYASNYSVQPVNVQSAGDENSQGDPQTYVEKGTPAGSDHQGRRRTQPCQHLTGHDRQRQTSKADVLEPAAKKRRSDAGAVPQPLCQGLASDAQACAKDAEPADVPTYGAQLQASDIAQHWLAHLLQGDGTQHLVNVVATKLVEEMMLNRRCPLDCIVGYMIASISECKHQLGGLQPDPAEALNGAGATSGAAGQLLRIGMVEGAAIEDILFSGAWYDELRRQQQHLTLLMACARGIDNMQAASVSNTTAFLEALQQQLARQLIATSSKRRPTQDTEDCALATALAMTYRMQGKMQAMRAFVLNLLVANLADGTYQMLPALTAALAAWPCVLSIKARQTASTCNEIIEIIQAALQDMCRNLLGNDSAQQDIETLADSMSLTTFSAATSSGPCIAALYLVQLGRQSWGWQDLGGQETDASEQQAKTSLKRLWTAMLDSRHDGKHSIALISLIQVLTACFGTDWVCEQIALEGATMRMNLGADMDTDLCKRLVHLLEVVASLSRLSKGSDMNKSKPENFLQELHVSILQLCST